MFTVNSPDLFFQYFLYSHQAPTANRAMQMSVPKMEPTTAPPHVGGVVVVVDVSSIISLAHKHTHKMRTNLQYQSETRIIENCVKIKIEQQGFIPHSFARLAMVSEKSASVVTGI